MAPRPPVLLLALLAAAAPSASRALTGFECKNASSDWPLPCRDPSAAIEQYHLGEPSAPANATFPISAWCMPPPPPPVTTHNAHHLHTPALFSS